MDTNYLDLLTYTGLCLIICGLAILIKPVEVWAVFKVLGTVDLRISQSDILAIGKIFILIGAVVFALDLFFNLSKKDPDMRH